jgi:hypothetical protein
MVIFPRCLRLFDEQNAVAVTFSNMPCTFAKTVPDGDFISRGEFPR